MVLMIWSLAYGFYTIGESNFEPSMPTNLMTKDSSRDALPVNDTSKPRQLSHYGKIKAGWLVFWIVIPPVWFWIEYVGLYRYDDAAQREVLDPRCCEQDLAGSNYSSDHSVLR